MLDNKRLEELLRSSIWEEVETAHRYLKRRGDPRYVHARRRMEVLRPSCPLDTALPVYRYRETANDMHTKRGNAIERPRTPTDGHRENQHRRPDIFQAPPKEGLRPFLSRDLLPLARKFILRVGSEYYGIIVLKDGAFAIQDEHRFLEASFVHDP